MKKKSEIKARLAHLRVLLNAQLESDEPDAALVNTFIAEIDAFEWVLQ